jgi:glycerate-2-kinase
MSLLPSAFDGFGGNYIIAAGNVPHDNLAGNDSYSFFRALSDQVVTGPTGTNVTDIAIGAVA